MLYQCFPIKEFFYHVDNTKAQLLCNLERRTLFFQNLDALLYIYLSFIFHHHLMPNLEHILHRPVLQPYWESSLLPNKMHRYSHLHLSSLKYFFQMDPLVIFQKEILIFPGYPLHFYHLKSLSIKFNKVHQRYLTRCYLNFFFSALVLN